MEMNWKFDGDFLLHAASFSMRDGAEVSRETRMEMNWRI
jgi:hypothetical protein